MGNGTRMGMSAVSNAGFKIQWWAVFLLAMVLAGISSATHAGPPAARQFYQRPQDEIWLISTRHLPPEAPCGHVVQPALKYQRYVYPHGWQAASADEFFASHDPSGQNKLNIVYVHGNRMTPDWTYYRGLQLYTAMVCDNDEAPAAVRYVIWSWPSEPIPCRFKVVKDAQIKARRTPMQSYYLGWWLAQLPARQRTSLLGYSFGGATILGALHLNAGGVLEGRQLPNQRPDHVRPRVVLWVPALQNNWLLPQARYGLALRDIDHLLLVYNRFDNVLTRYDRFLPGTTGPALGQTGFPRCHQMGEYQFHVAQLDAARIVGDQHKWDRYLESPLIMKQAQRYTFWHPVERLGASSVPRQR